MSMRGRPETTVEAVEPRSSDQKEFMTKAEYNRWLLKQENARLADERREEAKAGEEIIKERQRQHTTRGVVNERHKSLASPAKDGHVHLGAALVAFRESI